MKKRNNQNIKELLSNLAALASNSNKEKQCWMVRTDKGTNYSTFFNGGYIALNLENYPIRFVYEAKRTMDNPVTIKTYIKEHLKTLYKENKIVIKSDEYEKNLAVVLGRIAGQIYSISFDMKKGDVVLIPSSNSELLSIGEILDDELYIDNNRVNENFSFRRRVKWITTIPKRNLDPCLYRALGAHQAVSNISDYAEYIERNYNSIFSLNGEFHYVLTINADKVNARNTTRMINCILDFAEDFSNQYSLDINVNDIEMSVYLNSPGKIDLKSAAWSSAILVMAIAIALSGGSIKYKDCELTNNGLLSSLIEAINEYRKLTSEIEHKYQSCDYYFNSLETKSVEDWNLLIEQRIKDAD